MSVPEFGSLYYTDCLPGQGLRGGAGFQFQSVSEGVSHEVMTIVQRTSLYEAPVPWMREQRAVSAYPPSLAHVFDGSYVTARGVYLGAEANGVREGNQFTHAVTASTPETYGLVRPAQLWDSPWWSEKPAPSTRCDPVPAEPEPGRWGIDTVREWVLGQQDAEEWLTAVHSAFDRVHDADRRRVIFVGDDPGAVIGWIAAGTLLLPQARALRVGFRVFAANPQYSQHDVLALHLDWAGRYADTTRDNDAVVFNLATGRHSAIEPTESALHWVPRFLQSDPYDVIDAVELAHEYAHSRSAEQQSHEARPSPVDRLASGAVVLAEPVRDLNTAWVLAQWLAEQVGASVEDTVEPVLTVLLDGPVDVAVLRSLDDTAYRFGVNAGLCARVRHALFAAEIDAVVAGVFTLTERPLPSRRWSASERTALTTLVETAAQDVAPELMDPLLRTASRFGVEPGVAGFRHGAHRFITWWADHPAAAVTPAAWPCRPELIDLLRDELAHRLPGRAEAAIRQHWWTILLPTIVDRRTALDAAVSSAALEHADPGTRQRMITSTLDALRDQPAEARGDIAWRALFGFSPPTVDELVSLLRELPTGAVSHPVAERAHEVLAEATRRRVTARELDAVAVLAQRGWMPPPRQRRLRDLAGQDEALRRWLAAPSSNRAALAMVGKDVLIARSQELVRGLTAGAELTDALSTVERAGSDLPTILVHQLPLVWNDQTAGARVRAAALALAYLTAGVPNCPNQVALQFEEHLNRWARMAAQEDLRLVGRLIAAADEQAALEWREYVNKLLASSTTSKGKPKRAATKSANEKPKSHKRSGFSPWPFGRGHRGE